MNLFCREILGNGKLSEKFWRFDVVRLKNLINPSVLNVRRTYIRNFLKQNLVLLFQNVIHKNVMILQMDVIKKGNE